MAHKASVIIPVYNDPRGIEHTLRSVVNQNFPHETYEIIVVDNGSTDNTADIVHSFSNKWPLLVRLVSENKTQNSYVARNKGVNVSRGEIIVFIDADMTVERHWLNDVMNVFQDNQIAYIGTRVKMYLQKKSTVASYDMATDFNIERYINQSHFAPTCCLAVKKELFAHLGPFDSRLLSSADKEFGNRVYKAGYALSYIPSVVVYHPARQTLLQLLSKAFRLGRGFAQLINFYSYRYNNKKGLLPRVLRTKPGKRINTWRYLAYKRKLIFYLIDCLRNIVIHIGYVYEKQKNS